MTTPPTTRIVLTMEGSDIRRLARVLKAVLRAAGWKCVAITRQSGDVQRDGATG